MQELDRPIVYPVGDIPPQMQAVEQPRGRLHLRVAVRALEGMQKEAVVSRSPGGPGWRMLCDEGPYLKGTDFAPPPLSFFSAGMAAHHASLIMAEAGRDGMRLADLALQQHAYYSMDGSALRGTMTGGAHPAHLHAASNSVPARALDGVVERALRKSVAEQLMATAFTGEFSITRDGVPVETGRVMPSEEAAPGLVADMFDGIAPEPPSDWPDEIIARQSATSGGTHPDHGAGASLKEAQKRMLHIFTTMRLRDDGLKHLRVELIKPTGSTFTFLADDAGPGNMRGRAPDGLDYLAAGIALCFMTQMGRYATIVRKDLASYAVVQDMVFDLERTRIEPIRTHAFVSSSEDDATLRRFIDMSEQTCFLHAACRSVNPTLQQRLPE